VVGIRAEGNIVWISAALGRREGGEKGDASGGGGGMARVWLGAARFVGVGSSFCCVFVLRNEGRRILQFNGLDRLIGRSVGGVSWIFDWLKRG
jgi:hypothetical protein